MEIRRKVQLSDTGKRLFRATSYLLSYIEEGKNMSYHLYKGPFTYSLIYNSFISLRDSGLITTKLEGRQRLVTLTEKGKDIQRSILIIMETLRKNEKSPKYL